MRRTLGIVWKVAAIAAVALVVPRFASGADHIDAPAAMGEPLADINDAFAWMSSDAANLNMAITVGGLSAPSEYSGAVLYVFHIDRGAAYGDTPAGSEVRCLFADGDTFECWLIDGSDDSVVSYVTGDTDATDVESAEGMQVFAGLRDDPFVFEFQGFTNAVDAAREAAPGLPSNVFDDNGCILLEGTAFDNNVGTQSAENDIVQLLTSSPPAGATGAAAQDPDDRIAAADTFQGLNTQALVVSVPKSLIPGAPTGDTDVIAVWTSTHSVE